MNYTIRLIARLFTNFILYISILIKEKIYNRLEIFVSRIIFNFYFNFIHDGLLTAINKLLFDLHNVLVPKSKIEIVSLFFFCYNFLPFCTDRACLSAGELLYMTYSIQDYLGLVLLTYIIFIVILDLSICYISCNKEVKKFFPSLDFTINLALFLVLVILVCIFLLLLFLLFDKTVEILIEYISEYIIKMLTSNPGPRGSGQPGGFGQPAGGGGKPPKKPGGYSPNKGHYEDKNDDNEDLSDEESKKREAKKAKDRARANKYLAKLKANETEQERENRLAKNRARRAENNALKKDNETVEEWEKRLAKSELRETRRNLSETEKANLKRTEHREYIRNQTEEQRQNRLAKNRARRAKNKLRWFQRDQGNKSDEEKK